MAGLEQDFDAAVGRFVAWLAGDPLRHHKRLRTKAPDQEEEIQEERIEAIIAEAHEEKPPPASRKVKAAPAKKKTVAGKRTVAKKNAPSHKAATPEETLLDAIGDGASRAELLKRTGMKGTELTRRLGKLQQEGLVQRVGAGLRTRYERTGK